MPSTRRMHRRRFLLAFRSVKVKSPLYLSNCAMKAYGRMDVQIHVLLTSALVAGEWSASRPGPLPPRKVPDEAEWGSEPVWTTWRRENSCPPAPLSSSPYPVAILAFGSVEF
jgi:hypothetical protein